jgi:chitodextrinase
MNNKTHKRKPGVKMTKKTKAKKPPLKNARRFNVLLSAAVALVVAIGGYFVITSLAATGAATLSLDPAASIVENNGNFTVTIREDSGATTVNAVQIKLSYPADKLQFVSIDNSTSAFGTEAESVGGNGTVSIARGTSGGQFVTGSQVVSRVTFKSLMTTGSASVAFTTGTAVVNSVDNTALALTYVNGTYSPDTSAPTVPASLRTTAQTGTTISLAWNASTDNVGVTGYNLYRNNVKIASPTTLAYTDSGLAQGTTYQYTVSAFDKAGNESVKSSVLSVATKDTTAPSVPASVTLTALSHDQVRVNWAASTDTGGSGLAGYRVYRQPLTSPVGTVTASPYTDTGLTGSTGYTYQVAAYDNAGNESAKSATVSVTTPPAPDTTPPTTPTNFRATSSSLTSVSLAWNASTDNVSVSGYRVYRNGTLIGSPTTLTFTDSDRPFGTTYTYTVRAIDPSGNLSTAASITASTLPLKEGDVNRDNKVDIYDLSLLLASWQTTNAEADINNDGIVDIFDLSRLLSGWGK